MKFCKFCGKQLADDEVCSCQEGKTSQTAIKESPITQIVNLVKGTLDKPESAAKNFYYKGSVAIKPDFFILYPHYSNINLAGRSRGESAAHDSCPQYTPEKSLCKGCPHILK